MQITECKSCAAPIIWALTGTGKRMPIDARPDPYGRIEITSIRYDVPTITTHPQTPLHVPTLYTSHFATCPNADQHRKRN